MEIVSYIDNTWSVGANAGYRPIVNPATGAQLARMALTPTVEVGRAVEVGHRAYADWRATPVTDRIQHLFRLKTLLEEHLDELATTITNECGKTKQESLGELRRGIENVEVACGTPALIQGYNNEDIARGIDEHMVRQPLGVVAAITPFNFPGMIPLWFLPYAVATGNCFILKPSERVPMTSAKLFESIERAGFPPGVLQLVTGGKETVDALLDHPLVRAISFVGSTPVARYVYRRAGRRHGNHGAHHGRQRFRLRGATLPCRKRRGDRRRCTRGVYRAYRRYRRFAQRRLRLGPRRRDGAGHHARKQVAHRRYHRRW